MMHPNPFNDDLQESGIPMFGKNGTALSPEERSAIAKRRGLCLKCGTKTHQVKIMGRTPLNNEDVYQGICIKCNNHAVPSNVLADWQSRNAVAAVQPARNHITFKTAAQVSRITNSNISGNRPLGGSVRPMGSVGAPPESTAGQPLLRKDSRTSALDPHHYGRTSSHGSNSRGDFGGPIGSARSGDFGGLGNSGRSTDSRGLDNSGRAGDIRGLDNNHRTFSFGPGGRSSSRKVMGSEEYKTDPNLDPASVLNDIKANIDNPDVLRSKIHSLRNLADDHVGALPEIKTIIEKYRSDPRLVIVSLGAIWAIASQHVERKLEAASSGCLEAVVDIIRNGPTKDDSESLQWAFGAITSLARLDQNKKTLADLKAIEALLEAMKRKEKEPAVFEWGCRALFSIVSGDEENGHSGNYDRQMSIIENYGGISVIAGCMKLHHSEDGPLWWAFKVLFRMQGRSDPDAAIRSTQLMNEEDLSATCTKIMMGRDHAADVFIQCEAMLVYLITNASNQLMQQSAAECIPSVAQFLGDNSHDIALQETSALFLASVARDNLQAKREISRGGSLRLLTKGMSSAPENLALQQAVTSLLWILSADDSSFDLSILGEAKIAFETASIAHPADGELGQAICGFVANTASFAKGRSHDVPVDLVLQLLRSGCSGSQGGRALSALLGAFPDVNDRITQSGMIEMLLEGLCDANIDVRSSSAATLSAIMESSDAARTKIYDSGGLGTASAALFTAQSDALVHNLLLFVNAIVFGGSKKALQLPNEIIMAILQAVTTFPSQTKTACATIHNAMLVTVPGFKSVNTDGLAELLTAILESRSSSDDLIMEACGTLWAFTAKQPIAPDTSSQLFRSVLALCAKHKGDNTPFNSPVLTEAAGALAAVMQCIRDNPVHIPDTDIDLIISILDVVIDRDVENAALMERLLDVVFNLCFLCKELLIQFGVIVVVIDCMVEHEGVEAIQQKGCAILALLASTENLQVNLSIAETDGIDMMVSALAGFTENVLIQTDTCRALSHLSIDHESRMLISSQGGLILLVNAMNKFREEVDLLEAACSALLNLSSDAEEQVLAGSSVVETVVSTMRHQLNAPRLQEKCLGVLQNISMRSKDSKRAIADAGGIGAVTFAIKEFMGSPSVLERSFTTMWSLAVLEQNQIIIANEGGISLVINGMMANITFEKVQKQACGCLCTLASDSQNKTLIRDMGGVDAIVYAMWAHYDSDALLIEACRALASLAVNVQTNEVMIASDGEISAIMSAMKRFPQSERLQEHACVALRNFLLSADNAAIVRPQAAELQLLMNASSSRFPARCADRAKQIMASLR